MQNLNGQIIDGWAAGAARAASPNFETGHRARDCIVMHYTAGYTAESAIATFRNRASRASAHFVIETDGRIAQMVSLNDTAWHAGGGVFRGAGQVNQRSIGIEIVNPGYHFRSDTGEWLNWQRKTVPAARLRPFPGMLEARDPWVGSAAAFWPLYPEGQLRAVEQIVTACLGAFPSISAIVGHRDVDTVRRLKVDPGPAFPMERMRRLLAQPGREAARAGRPMRVVSPETPLNIRSGPGTRYERLKRGPLPHGRQVQALEARGEWLRVRVEDSGGLAAPFEGWCHGGYLKPVGSGTIATRH